MGDLKMDSCCRFRVGLGFNLLKLANNQCNRTSMEGGEWRGKTSGRKKETERETGVVIGLGRVFE